MLDKESTQISLDQLYEDEEIGHYVKNIQIDSPFQQLTLHYLNICIQ